MAIQQSEVKEIFKPGRFSRESEIKRELPFSVSTMWRRCREGTFPRPVKLSENVTAWNNDQLNLWFWEQSKKFEEVES